MDDNKVFFLWTVIVVLACQEMSHFQQNSVDHIVENLSTCLLKFQKDIIRVDYDNHHKGIKLRTSQKVTTHLKFHIRVTVIIILCHLSIFFHHPAHSFPMSLISRKSFKVHGCVRSEHCIKCFVFSMSVLTYTS